MTLESSVRSTLTEAVFDEHPDQIAVIDTDGVIRATNRAWETFGAENGAVIATDMIGDNYLAACRNGDDEVGARAADGIEAVIDGSQSTFTVEYPCHSPTEQRWFTMHAQPFTVAEESFVLIDHADITDRYQAEQAVAERNELLELVAGVLSHDLRSPLSVALARIELIESDGTHADTVRGSLERMGDIIEDALLIAREKDLGPLETVALDSAAQNAWAHVSTGDATLTVDTAASIAADASLLSQLLENLFRNSVEHGTGDGQPRSTDAGAVAVTVTARDDGFAVTDDGPGIPPDRREQVFNAGFTTSTQGTGTGLGLLIVREIARAHGWSVRATDAPGGGAMVVVSGASMSE
ncbi:PAS domain-containing sensor histidine kinase [Haloarcula sp. S1AR25-5A]|uniref:histidine kinase n=1 Tax=Haloarcula terrestris TaxID=2950533 RepID=A0AAE4EXB4_9EURY|nr:PAS domain-containing sensor histidine kinase [Haloarcula terrestris]MDS0220408.1 PAS domain-containing sensor histidine kinase [Haloarcula terrestris]